MRLFELHRDEDVNGNSGTGIVAQGVEFDNGFVAYTWLSHLQTVTTAPSVRVVDGLHSHEGRTKLVFIDPKVVREYLAHMDENEVRGIYNELRTRFEVPEEPLEASAPDIDIDIDPDPKDD